MGRIFSPSEASRSLDEGQAKSAERATWNLSNKLAHLDWPNEDHTVEVRLKGIVPFLDSFRHGPDGSDKIEREAVQRHIDTGWQMKYDVDDEGCLLWVSNPVWINPDQGICYPKTSISIRPLDTTTGRWWGFSSRYLCLAFLCGYRVGYCFTPSKSFFDREVS